MRLSLASHPAATVASRPIDKLERTVTTSFESPSDPAPDPAPIRSADGASSAAPVAVAKRPNSAELLLRAAPLLGLLALLVALAALTIGWSGRQRVQALEQELVRRQIDSASQAAEARLLADQSQVLAREAVAKATLLETRLAEVTLQRGQLEELMRSLSRSRDENIVADIDAGLRVAIQQTAVTGSAAPLVAALRSAEERLTRFGEPRLEAARRAIARDIDRVKAASVADVAALSIRLDEAARLVDELPLLVIDAATLAASSPSSHSSAVPGPRGPVAAALPARAASVPGVPASAGIPAWRAWVPASALLSLGTGWDTLLKELRSLMRVTRIDQPQALLLAPEQSYFLRENLKLRLLNARLALLSRQFDTAQSDLQQALAAIDAHFDRSARKTQIAVELLRGVAQQARQSAVPRPDETLSVLAAAAAGR